MRAALTLLSNWHQALSNRPSSWAHASFLLQARYRAGLPLVLKGLSFSVAPGTICGVVGRTGSGKSSLLLALFRLIDIDGGCVRLGGDDVARAPLPALRRQIAIIPQDPLLFSGALFEFDCCAGSARTGLTELTAMLQRGRSVEEVAHLVAASAFLTQELRQMFTDWGWRDRWYHLRG